LLFIILAVNEDHESTKEEIEDEEIITNDEYQQSDNNNNQIDQTHIDQYVRGGIYNFNKV
jgi:hypothetical protein